MNSNVIGTLPWTRAYRSIKVQDLPLISDSEIVQVIHERTRLRNDGDDWCLEFLENVQ